MLKEEVQEKERRLLTNIISAIQNEEDDEVYGDLCCVLIDQLVECYKNNIKLYVPIIEEDAYGGEYLIKLDDDVLVSKEIKNMENHILHQAYTSNALVNSEYSISMTINDVVKDSLIDKDIEGLLINDFVLDKKTLGYLVGLE